jgi:hypothetical protein
MWCSVKTAEITMQGFPRGLVMYNQTNTLTMCEEGKIFAIPELQSGWLTV